MGGNKGRGGSESKVKCEICGILKFPSALEKHIRTHTKERPYKCSYCEKSYRYENDLKRHLQQHSGNTQKCPTCHIICLTEDRLRRHIIRHHKPAKTAILHNCEMCGYKTTSSFRLNQHLGTHTRERPFSCPVCNKTFRTRYHVTLHKSIHAANREMHTCQICHKEYTNKSNILRHMKNHTGAGERGYGCELCGKRFTAKAYLVEHTRSHTKEKTHRCPLCNKGLTKQGLRYHLKSTHAGEKPYSCGQCSAKFTSRRSLQQHIMVVHDGGGPVPQKRFECSTCNKKFQWNYSLKLHEKTHLPSRRRVHTCVFCDKGFFTNHALNLHLLSHIHEKHFSCGICGREFTTRGVRNSHMLTHRKEKEMHSCSDCGLTFSWLKSLNQHKKRKHAKQIKTNNNTCPFCLARASTEEGLRSHIRNHVQEEPYFCKCGKEFDSWGGLMAHRCGIREDIKSLEIRLDEIRR